MIERIKKIIDVENIGIVKFANEIGIGSPALSHYLSGRNKIPLELVTKILERFRGINPEWLLFGRGEMYKSTEVKLAKHEPDLFSSAEQKQIDLPLMENDADKSDQSTDNGDFFEPETNNKMENLNQNTENKHVMHTQDNIQKEHVAIEKIIVMYSDSTFDCYSPNGRRM